MIEGFILPKVPSRAPRNFVALPGTRAFERACQPADWTQWSNQEVDVVCHDYKSMQAIVPQFIRASFDDQSDAFRKAFVLQPKRAVSGPIQP